MDINSLNSIIEKKIGKAKFKNFYKVTDILKFTKNQFTNNSIE